MEVQPATAAAASIQNEGTTNSPAALSRARSATICILSLLFAWLTTLTLRHIDAAAEKEEDYLVSAAVVRGLSPLVSAYLFSSTAALQGVNGVAGTMFLRVTFLLLLAGAAARLVNPIAGAAAMFLVTVHSATALGGALAVLRQQAGADVTAAAAVMSANPYRSRAEERHVESCRTARIATVVLAVVLTFGSLALATWLAPPEEKKVEEEESNAELFVVMVFAGPFLIITRQLFFLDGSPLQVEFLKFVVGMGGGVVGWIVAMVVANFLVGGNAPGIVIWAGALAMAGFFGYGRAVEAKFEELMAVKRSEPRTAEDASGLLVGRDEEDACSAHIDAYSSVCLDCAVRPGCHCWSR